MGSRDYAMRVWLNPNRLAAYNMVPQDVTEAIRNQNIEAAPDVYKRQVLYKRWESGTGRHT